MVRSAAVALAIVLGSNVTTAQAQGTIDTGNSYLSLCENVKGDANFSSGVCIGYIQGFLDTSVLMRQGNSCIPAGVTNGQVWDLFVKYLQENPDKRHLPTIILLASATIEAWPCSN